MAKPKPQASKRLQRQNSSGSSTGEEEPKKEIQVEELVVPVKGKEIPRTPPVGGKADPKSEEFIKPVLGTSPRTRSLNNAAGTKCFLALTRKNHLIFLFYVAKKNFQPILPTKEIPRTPLKGVQQQASADVSLFGRNPDLTVDFSVSRLTSSNTSTPIEERSSNKTFQCADATFVVPANQNSDEELASPPFQDNKAIRRGTFVLTHATEQQTAMSQEQEATKVDAEAVNEEHQPDAEASPKIPETKKKGGRQPKKNAKAAPEPEKPAQATDMKSENSDVAPAEAKGRKGRGKKAAAAAAVDETPAEEANEVAPVQAEVKDTKKRGKKDKIEEPSEQEAPVAEAPAPEPGYIT